MSHECSAISPSLVVSFTDSLIVDTTLLTFLTF